MDCTDLLTDGLDEAWAMVAGLELIAWVPAFVLTVTKLVALTDTGQDATPLLADFTLLPNKFTLSVVLVATDVIVN